MIERAGFAIYAACVDFLLQASRLLGITYRDANALVFFVVWPLLTLALLAIVIAQRRTLRRLHKGGRVASTRSTVAASAARPVKR